MKIFKQLKKILDHPLNYNRKIITIGKIVWWKINQIFFRIPAIIQITTDAKLVCYPQSSYGSFVVYANFPEYEEMKFIQDIVTDGDVVLDVGANIGSISILAASKGEKVSVFAFEPTEKLLPLIRENIGVNQFEKRIMVFQTAVSDKNGNVSFVLKKESEVNHIDTNNSKNSVSINSITLDSFAKQNRINKIDLLKVDVEGAEMLVFRGSKRLLQNNQVRIILFEVNKNSLQFGYSAQQLVEFFRQNNYFVFFFCKHDRLELVPNKFIFKDTSNLVAVSKDAHSIRKIMKYLSDVSYT